MTNSKNPGSMSDELIRDALHRELNDIEPPPPEMMWRRIQNGINRSKTAVQPRRRLNYINLSAVAAALLVFVFGTLHLYRSVQWPAAPDDNILTEAGRSDLLSVDNDCTETVELPYGWLESGELSEKADPVPASINGRFVPEQVASREGPGGEYFDAAVYTAGDVSLFWVRARSVTADLSSFLADLSAVVEVVLEPSVTANGVLYFYADGRPGLAWREDSFTYALWVITGDLSPETLHELLN